MASYIAYPFGKLNQSCRMKDADNATVYEAELTKFHLFGASEYTFRNKVAGTEEIHRIGKTVTKSSGPEGAETVTESYFKIDGENVFDRLEEMGLRFRVIAKLDLMHPEFALVGDGGNEIARYKMNVRGERQEDVAAIGGKQRNTAIETESSDLATVFFGAFVLNRVDFSLFLI
ncbi:MAG: hypothetical protein Q4C53_07250 [Clostridia bacterium]|nr:hypothetical protein [Clostridia bacterium]